MACGTGVVAPCVHWKDRVGRFSKSALGSRARQRQLARRSRQDGSRASICFFSASRDESMVPRMRSMHLKTMHNSEAKKMEAEF